MSVEAITEQQREFDPREIEAIRTMQKLRGDISPSVLARAGITVEGVPITSTADVSVFTGATTVLPYGGTEGPQDIPARVIVPKHFRANLPA